MEDREFQFMRRFDYARYAPLGFYYDPTLDFKRGELPILSCRNRRAWRRSSCLLLKSRHTAGVRCGPQVARVYVNSWAVTAQVWMDYLDQGRHQQVAHARLAGR